MSSPENSQSDAYRGRFAPSPTGELHMGSLLAATASYLEARVNNGEWLLRVEDLDPPREVPGSAASILRTLERLGFEWDGPVLYQSSRKEAYEHALQSLLAQGDAYPCACSRAEVAANATTNGPEGPIYPGTCRNGLPEDREGRAVRARITPDSTVCFTDRLQDEICQDVAAEIGDFVIRRADGYFAYQLAVVVDDAYQNVTDIVRGKDLLLSTPRQIWLQRRLGQPTPTYLHIPLLLGSDGRKLSKQARSQPVDPARPVAALHAALTLLQQAPPSELVDADVRVLWSWATAHWQPQRLRQIEQMTCVTD